MTGKHYPDLTRCGACGERVDTVWTVDGTARRICIDCIADAVRLETPDEKARRGWIVADQDWPGAAA